MAADIEQFFDFIESYVRLSDELKQSIIDKITLVSAPKGHLLLSDDTIPRYIWFIVSGSVRTFYYHNEREVTSWIYDKGQMVTAFGSFYAQISSYDHLQCTEDSELVQISFDQLMWLYDHYPEMDRFGRMMNEEIVMTIDQFSKGIMFMSAREKYEMLLEFFPEVASRVNLGYVASMLGITQETLSRIRAQQK